MPYIPEVFGDPLPASGGSAERKRWLLRGRLLCKQGKEERRLRRLRRKEAKIEVREVIRAFCEDADQELLTPAHTPVEEVADDASDEEFWTSLPIVSDCEAHPRAAHSAQSQLSGQGCKITTGGVGAGSKAP